MFVPVMVTGKTTPEALGAAVIVLESSLASTVNPMEVAPTAAHPVGERTPPALSVRT
jgi:hypothetical protein